MSYNKTKIINKSPHGGNRMLETSQERVKLLKAGIDGKSIEKLYLIYNNFKIVSFPMLFEVVEINIEPKGLTYEKDERER